MTVHQTITTDDSQKVCDKGQFIVSNMLGTVLLELKLILYNHNFFSSTTTCSQLSIQITYVCIHKQTQHSHLKYIHIYSIYTKMCG
jgi:hypothetical protein